MRELLNEQVKTDESKGNTMNNVYNSIMKGLEEAINDAQSTKKELKQNTQRLL